MSDFYRLTAEIDLDAVKMNIKNIRAKTGNNIKMICVVKADAYGHGAVEISKTAIESGADMLAVAVVDEAVELKRSGIEVPVLVLGYTSKTRMKDVVNFGITQTVYTREMAKELSLAAKEAGVKAKVHIKIDTGMGRLGFRNNKEDIESIKYITSLENIDAEGIFTHFSSADETDKAFTYKQAEDFKNIINILAEDGITFPVIHGANSAGIMDFDNMLFTAVRPGIIQYGLYPSADVNKENLEIKPVMSLKSHISFIKAVSAGTPIGYGRTYVTECERVIATIPVGYADGYLRCMKNGGKVIVNGKFAPIVGRICMDQFMVDITDIENVKIGDEVIIMGRSGEAEITADDIAKIMDTINYEVVCLVSRRVPRVYIENGKERKTVSYI